MKDSGRLLKEHISMFLIIVIRCRKPGLDLKIYALFMIFTNCLLHLSRISAKLPVWSLRSADEGYCKDTCISGTTGKPTVVDIPETIFLPGLKLCTYSHLCGSRQERFYPGCLRLWTFYRGLGLHYGGENRSFCNSYFWWNTVRQIQLMHDLARQCWPAHPQYALFLAEAIQDSGISRGDLN